MPLKKENSHGEVNKTVRLSILDQVPISAGQTAEESIAQTMLLVQKAEIWGYERYWFAEHHGTKGLASSSPELLMAAAAAQTARIHVGSGGILLPQYSAYKVASQLKQLQAMFPGRIDGGVGRSPGGTEKIRFALANEKKAELDLFWQKVDDVVEWIQNKRHNMISASPQTQEPQQLFVLGLGENSAIEAGNRGLGFVHGYFIEPDQVIAAHEAYRNSFKTGLLKRLEALTAVFIVCGETDEHAERLAKSQDWWLLQTEKGLDSRVPKGAGSKRLTNKELERIKVNRKRMIVGSPMTVKKELDKLSARIGSDQFLVLCNIYDFKEKMRSFERLATIYSL